jgi:hypothetical protein
MTSEELEYFAAALEDLTLAFADYRGKTGGEAVLVGGGAVIVHIGGSFFSGDLDFVAADSCAMDECMRARGFVAEHRAGRLQPAGTTRGTRSLASSRCRVRSSTGGPTQG